MKGLIGISIALLLAFMSVAFSGESLVYGLFRGLNFLWIWYWIYAGVVIVLMAIVLLPIIAGFALGGGALGAEHSKTVSALGGTLGLATGGAFSALLAFLVGARHALMLGGVYLLRESGTALYTFKELNMQYLVLGAIMLVIGVLITRKKTETQSK